MLIARGSTQSSTRGSTRSSTRSFARGSARSSTRSSTYRGSARGSARSSAYGGSTRSSASGPRYIPIAYTCLCHVYLCSHLIFYPSFLIFSLPREALERQPAEDRHQNQTTTVRTTSQQTPRTIQLIDRSN